MDIRLLGHLEVVDSRGRPIAVHGEGQKALLARLAVSYPRPVTSDVLIDVLWHEEPVEEPDAALQVAVSRLRKAVGSKVIATVPAGYRLDAPGGSIDVERFRSHTKRGRQLLTLGRPGQAAEAFRQALAQWHGSPLSDLHRFAFAEEFARGLESERIDVVEWLMESVLEAGDHQLVVGELAGLAEAHPTRERLWYLLMLALYRCGRQAEALRAYGRLRSILGEEMGIEPSPQLSDLEERILLHDPSLADHSIDTSSEAWGEEPQMASFQPRDIIVEEGTRADAVYWIEDGSVEVTRHSEAGEERLAELGRGRYFGELASLLGTARTASVRALETTTVSVHSVAGFRHRLGVERAKGPDSNDPVRAVGDLVRRGDYLRAYDTATASIERGDAGLQLRYLAILALARAGATSLARRRFSTLGLDTVDVSSTSPSLAQDLAALLPRLDKDMAMSDKAGEPTWARRSAQGYEAAYHRKASPYLGSNAATMWLMAGESDKAIHIADEVLQSFAGTSDGSYWQAVTEAECALVLGRIDQAADALSRAGAAADSDAAARATTLRQLRMVCRILGTDAGILAPILNPLVVHYSGHRVASVDSPGRFPADEEPRVATELKRCFADLGVGIGYGSLAAGADILAAEALLDLAAELHVVLPFDRDEFVRVSVAPAGEQWVHRFETCLAAASEVTTATTGEHLDDPVLFDFCAQIAMGDAVGRADVLETEAVQVAAWDGARQGGQAGTEVDVANWRSTGNRSIVIAVGDGENLATTVSPPKRQIRGLVFADFAGFSALSDAQVVTFQDIVMCALAKTVARFDDHLLSGRTWGDGLYLVFGDICAAAECALALQATVREIDLTRAGLGGLRGMRVAAHAAPVFDGWDPIGGTRLFYGTGVTQTARIEPRTPEGEVYVTHPFAALAVLSGDRGFDCNYVGTIQAAKGYGPIPLYNLRSHDPHPS